MSRLYVNLCRRWGPGGLTFSAYAWKRAQETGDKWLRNRIDGAALLFWSDHNHCQSCFQRERNKQPKKDRP